MIVKIEDIVSEGLIAGAIDVLPGLSHDETIGVLTTLSKLTQQSIDEITDKGFGKYGLQIQHLQDIGFIKKNILITELVWHDPSIYTGKNQIYNFDDLLNEKIQSEIATQILKQKIILLTSLGIILTEATSDIISTLAIGSLKFNPDDLNKWVDGTASDEINSEMNTIKESTKYSINLVNTKAADTLQQIQGIGGGTVITPTFSKGTVDLSDIDSEINKIIGSKRIKFSTKEIIKSTTIKPEDLF